MVKINDPFMGTEHEQQESEKNSTLSEATDKKVNSNDPFRTYKKRQGAVDQGKEYEQLMCAFYALKLIARDDVEDFEMTTNSEEYGRFDDIILKITYKGGNIRTYLFQLKHKEAAKSITKEDLLCPKRDFTIEKYFTSMSTSAAITEDVVCILYTNSPIHRGMQIGENGENIFLKKLDYIEFGDLLSNHELSKGDDSIFEVTQTLDRKLQKFYFFTGQDNLSETASHVEKMLQDLLQINIYSTFIQFMTEWWSRNFVLNRNDVIAKVTELVFSPYIKCLSDNKCNNKTEYLKEAIMDFPITVVEKDEKNIVENIWSKDVTTPDEFNKTENKFRLKTHKQILSSWYLNRAPLIVRVDHSNQNIIKCVMKLMKKSSDNKKIILVGKVTSDCLDGIEVFHKFSDLTNKFKAKEYYYNILCNFEVSLQGRQPMVLQQFINIDATVANNIGVGELLTMSQTEYTVGNKIGEMSGFHIARQVSTVFVKTSSLLNIFESQKNQTMIIINCDATFKNRFLGLKNIQSVEKSDYLRDTYNKNEDLIIFSTKNKCTYAEFNSVCEKSKKSNVYLFQTFNDKFFTLLSKKGNDLPPEFIDKSIEIKEKDILKYFDNPLNVICAPPGMGKSTLMTVLHNNCPSNVWRMYVPLIDYNSFLTTKQSQISLLDYILTMEASKQNTIGNQVRNVFHKNKKIHLYFDGLDEINSDYVNCVLDCVKQALGRGFNVWISSRENLREMISTSLNAIPIEIKEFNKSQQEEYVHNKLSKKYEKEAREKIIRAIFQSADLNNSQALLGVPLQLHIITEMFLNNDEAYKNIEDKSIFVLTKMYKMYFDGKIKVAIEKVVSADKAHQLGNIKASLKQYEPLALKACLDKKDFEKLNVNLKDAEDFIKETKVNGDKYGIIKEINEHEDAIFYHQTYAEYFACVWLKRNSDKAALLRDVIFSERYVNVRLMFDVMLAENNPLHLSIIYKNSNQFDKHLDKVEERDQGGRIALHLLCTYGMKYPTKRSNLSNREHNWYIKMIQKLTQENINIYDKDDLFNFSYVNYSIKTRCLYPIEIILDKKLLNFKELKSTLFEYYDYLTLAYYAAKFGYPNLFSALVNEKPQLVNETIDGEYLLETAVNGTHNDCVTPPREGNINVVNILLRREKKHIKNLKILDKVCTRGKYDMIKILKENGADCHTIWHRLAESKPISKKELKSLENIQFDTDVNMVNEKGLTPLHIASGNGNIHIIEFLLKKENIDVNALNKNGKTALHIACENGDYEITAVLLKKGASVNILGEQDNNALHYASMSKRDSQNIIKLLVDKGLDINAQNKNGTTALQIACENGDVEFTKKLLDSNACLNITDKNNNNALHYAAKSWKSNRDTIKLLIEKGIDLNGQNQNGKTALQLACENGDSEMIKMLLKHGACINGMDKDNNNALHCAAKKWNDSRYIIKSLIEKGIDVNVQNKSGITALHLACGNADQEIVEMLLKQFPSISAEDNDNNNAFHYASTFWKRSRSIIKLLIKNGIHVNGKNKNGMSGLELACENGDYEITEILLNHVDGRNIRDNINNAFYYAAKSWKDNRNLIRLLIHHGLHINTQNRNGTTPLHVACENDDFELTKEFLERGASVNTFDINKKNALHYGCLSNKDNPELIEFLFNKGINVNTQDKNGTTALQLACEKDKTQTVEMLFECGASVNSLDNYQNGALHYASKGEYDNEGIIKILIRKGINVDTKNKNGTTALHLACENCKNKTTKVLLENGASINIMDIENKNALQYALKSKGENSNIIKLLQEKNVLSERKLCQNIKK